MSYTVEARGFGREGLSSHAGDRFAFEKADPWGLSGTSVGFQDKFNRPDGNVGNGWSPSVDNIGGATLVIDNHAVTTTGFNDNFAGIYRPFDIDIEEAAKIKAKMDITELSGFGGLLRRYDTRILFGSDGSVANGYGVQVTRGDQNFSDSRVTLVLNGTAVDSEFSNFQFGAEIHVSVTYHSDGRVTGKVTGDGNTFHFGFDPMEVEFGGNNFELVTGGPDARDEGPHTFPTIDNVVLIQQPGSSAEGAGGVGAPFSAHDLMDI